MSMKLAHALVVALALVGWLRTSADELGVGSTGGLFATVEVGMRDCRDICTSTPSSVMPR